MFNAIKIYEDMYWVGANDRRIELFENSYPVPYGVSYNSYLILDEKNILLDGVDSSVTAQFIDNIKTVLKGQDLHYVIINHMEPDHCSGFVELALHYPNIKFIGNVKTLKILQQFYTNLSEKSFITVAEGDSFTTGKHSFHFYLAPMVHWPEVMVTYDSSSKTLFSADAFGTFGALNGNLYFDEIADKEFYFSESRRYYSNIVGKYGPQTLALLKKAAALDIALICPLHGPIWRSDFEQLIARYQKWAAYQPEEQSVTIAYGSVYGNTQQAAEKLAQLLAEKGVKNIKVYDVAKTHPSYILADAFRTSVLACLSATYNNGLFAATETFLLEFAGHNVANRKIALVENGTWSPQANKLMEGMVGSLKNTTILEPKITIHSACKEETIEQLEILAENIKNSL